MRPRGEIRLALSMAAAEFGRTGASFRDLAHRSQVALSDAQRTLDNMAAAGELERVGTTRRPGVSRPLNLYAVPLPVEPEAAELVDVVRCWAEFR